MKKIIELTLLALLVFSCQDDKKEDVLDIIKINNKNYKNQIISYSIDGTINYNKSHFYKIRNNCLEYHSFFDTLNTKLGVDRFITFKTSKSLSSNFLIKDKGIEFEKFFFQTPNNICLDNDFPKYGIIEDIVFLKTDSIVQGEQGIRILKSEMYFSFNKALE